ncbi:cytosine/adenosine deaminase-related metal-dependent hydrolase [Bradyrhizobium sp. GM2.4]
MRRRQRRSLHPASIVSTSSGRDRDKRLGKHALVVGPNVSFAHMNVLRDDEVDAVVRSGMSAIWHPGNFLFYGIGESARQRMLRVPISVSAAMFASCGPLANRPTLHTSQAAPKAITFRRAACWRLRQWGGQRQCWQDRIGSIELSKRADLVIRRNDLPECCPGTDLVFESVLVARSKSVNTVICTGQIIVKGGESIRLD